MQALKKVLCGMGISLMDFQYNPFNLYAKATKFYFGTLKSEATESVLLSLGCLMLKFWQLCEDECVCHLDGETQW